ncbi:DUF6461 domain-containing protein [Streptomyces hokutonensis]|uniref:DUF6461 domain-containing protein n=1 Tax=Streptomyces hokutonensis TaxID=1306990 RepID=UPI0033F1C2C3
MEHFAVPEDEIFTLGIEAFCLFYVHDMTQNDLLRNLGAQSRSVTQLDLWDSENLVGPDSQSGSLVRAGSVAHWAFCFETYGNLGADPGMLTPLSQGTEILSFNYAGTTVIQRWKNGQCVELFEPMTPATLHTYGDKPLWDSTQRYLLEARKQGADMWPISAALAAVHTKVGAPVTVDVIVEPLAAAWIPYVAPRNFVDVLLPPRLYQDPIPREIHKIVDAD